MFDDARFDIPTTGTDHCHAPEGTRRTAGHRRARGRARAPLATRRSVASPHRTSEQVRGRRETPALLVNTPSARCSGRGPRRYTSSSSSRASCSPSASARAPSQWSSYFPSRFARLYLPVFARGAPRSSGDGASRPTRVERRTASGCGSRPADYDLSGRARRTSCSSGGRPARITPLWSLQWEMHLLRSCSRCTSTHRQAHAPVALQLVIFFALATLGTYAGIASLKFLPMFGIGVALASLWDGLSDRLARLPRRRAAVLWLSALVVAVLMVTSFWTMRKTLPAELVQVVTLPLDPRGDLRDHRRRRQRADPRARCCRVACSASSA